MKRSIASIEQMEALLACVEEAPLSVRARRRLTWLIHHLRTGESVRKTCRRFRIARSTLHRLLERFDLDDPQSLEDRSRRPHTIRFHISEEAVAWIRKYRIHLPHLDHRRIAFLLQKYHGIQISPSSVYRTMVREELTEPASTAELQILTPVGI